LLCRRDAKISAALDPDAVYGVLLQLARITRTKNANVGPITLSEIQKAFENLFGQLPDEQSAVMLQRLPGLGRVKAESNDRQFLDTFILDGLRAIDVHDSVLRAENQLENHIWVNPLGSLGQRILADKIQNHNTRNVLLTLARRCASSKNKILACDVVASILRLNDVEPDFGGLAITDGAFVELDMTPAPARMWLSNTSFGTLILCPQVPRDTKLTDCIANHISGVTSVKGLPSWADVHADHFDDVGTVAEIKRSNLLPSQQILITIIRKTFMQKGSGRKEEALLRGLGAVGSSALANKILNLMGRDGLLRTVPGKEGKLYIPERSNTGRMKKIMDELNTSTDPLWMEVSKLS